MKVVLTQISGALRSVINSFFSNDLDVMSEEVRQILSNKDDAEKYKEAVKKIESGEQTITITLSNNKELSKTIFLKELHIPLSISSST